jgi:prepilin-type N-terminal cleavage/methylation domain-containing protein
MKKFSKAFTLIELLVVISIISGLSTITLSATSGVRAKTRDSNRISQIKEIEKALEIYYSNHGQYPSHKDSTAPFMNRYAIPYHWKNLIKELSDEGLISATVTIDNQQKIKSQFYSELIKTVYAIGGTPIYFPCSIQDPQYKDVNDYDISFGYQPSPITENSQHYIIRFHLENSDNLVFQSSITGPFLDDSTTGITACDTSLGYYCVSK